MNALEDFLEWMDKPISDENTPTYYGWTICAVAALQVFFSGPGQALVLKEHRYGPYPCAEVRCAYRDP